MVKLILMCVCIADSSTGHYTNPALANHNSEMKKNEGNSKVCVSLCVHL